jgi:hypothetical protein
MRVNRLFVWGIGLAVLVPSLVAGQAQDASRAVKGGGISVPGWQGKIDAQEEKSGQVLNNSKLVPDGNGAVKVTTGPAVAYWNPKNVAGGTYTVKATFTEADFMGLNDHPHPYGIVIAGNDMGTPEQSYLYCATYGNGTFIVRGFGPAPFAMGGRRPTAHDAVNKAAAKGSPVTQEIAMTVKADSVECAVNGKVVASYPKSELVGAGKLKSTDGIYGIRFAHNTEGVVTGLTMTKQ